MPAEDNLRTIEALYAALDRQAGQTISEPSKIVLLYVFDPAAAARFLGVMGRFAQFSAGTGTQDEDFLSSHPSTPDRIEKAAAAGGNSFRAPQDHGFMYAHGFEDLDGHIWELVWMNPDAAPPQA